MGTAVDWRGLSGRIGVVQGFARLAFATAPLWRNAYGMTDDTPAEHPRQQERDVAQRIGLVVVRWGHIEAHSHRLTWQLWRWEDQPGRTITKGMKVDRLWNLIAAGIELEEHRIEDLPRFAAWRTGADKLRQRRNDAVHSLWALDLELQMAASDEIRAAKDGSPRSPFQDWRSELDELAERISQADVELISIAHDLEAADRWFEESMEDHSTAFA